MEQYGEIAVQVAYLEAETRLGTAMNFCRKFPLAAVTNRGYTIFRHKRGTWDLSLYSQADLCSHALQHSIMAGITLFP